MYTYTPQVPSVKRFQEERNVSPIKKSPIRAAQLASQDDRRWEEQVISPIQKAIKACDVNAFKSGLQKNFQRDWDLLKGRVLHKIIIQGNTVLHEAALVRGASHILETICQHAPFLMGKTNLNGETVWHIAARENISNDVFEILYKTRQFWKVKLEAAGTATLPVNGVFGGMDDLSIRAVNINYGNTALHEALLSKNMLVAQKLFYADKELCYKVNGENKSPMQLALEIGDAVLFESMFRYAASTPLGMSAIKVQKITLTQIALGRMHDDWVIDLIGKTSTGREAVHPFNREVGASLPPNYIPIVASMATDDGISQSSSKRKPISYIDLTHRKSALIIESLRTHENNKVGLTSDDPLVDPIEEVRLAVSYAILHYTRTFTTFKKDLASRLSKAAADIETDMRNLVQSEYHNDDPMIMINQLQFLSILIFFLSLPFTFTSKPTFRLFFAINKLLWFVVCYGTLVLAVARQSGNMIGLTSGVLAQYLKIVKFMVMLELIVGISVIAYKFHLFTIAIMVVEWSYNFLL